MEAYGSLFRVALGSPHDIANTIEKTIPLLFTGLAVAIGFKSNMLNIGAEGQQYFGGFKQMDFTSDYFPCRNHWRGYSSDHYWIL
ncbi:ABC transporter permease [Carnobacterium alterfunditum]|uniref:ABC transporter permease n=1 Tax=Carnobacterium alterfunditum TaxID=28230 RepID=UPI00055682B5|nr:ABC transporter permease [Carnobacterium alterfunditum]